METGDLGQEIYLTLRRHGPIRLNDIAKKTGRSGSTISYQLQKMKNKGIIVCTKEKYYRLADTKEIEKAILQVTQRRTLPAEQILQAEELKSFDNDKVKAVFDKMIITGLLERVEEWVHKEKGFPEPAEKGYKLSFLGCRELGVCYFCNGSVSADFAIEGIVSEKSYEITHYGLSLHPTCIAKWIERDWGAGDIYFEGTSCSFCGLPIDANNLIQLLGSRNTIQFSNMRRYLSSEEDEALREKTEESSLSYTSVEYAEDRSDIERIVNRIVERAKERDIKLSEYDQQARIDQLWTIAQRLIEQKQSKWDNMLRLCSPLLESISIIYSQLPTYWAHNLRRYEIFASKDPKSGQEKEELLPVKFLEGGHTPVMLENGRRYHLYCYKLAKEFRILPSKEEILK
jgi:predicted transcriptional regulator